MAANKRSANSFLRLASKCSAKDGCSLILFDFVKLSPKSLSARMADLVFEDCTGRFFRIGERLRVSLSCRDRSRRASDVGREHKRHKARPKVFHPR
jgi:hypothetical protein